MKTFLKILLAIVIVAALCVGVYFVLPENTQMYVKGNIQYRTDDTAKEHVDKIKAITIPDYDVTFGDGLEAFCKTTAWYYEETSADTWTVTFYGSKATVNLTETSLDVYYTDEPFKVTFTVRNDSAVDISMEIDGDSLSGDDAVKEATYKTIAKAAN